MSRARRVDANHAQIIADLRSIGAAVLDVHALPCVPPRSQRRRATHTLASRPRTATLPIRYFVRPSQRKRAC